MGEKGQGWGWGQGTGDREGRRLKVAVGMGMKMGMKMGRMGTIRRMWMAAGTKFGSGMGSGMKMGMKMGRRMGTKRGIWVTVGTKLGTGMGTGQLPAPAGGVAATAPFWDSPRSPPDPVSLVWGRSGQFFVMMSPQEVLQGGAQRSIAPRAHPYSP